MSWNSGPRAELDTALRRRLAAGTVGCNPKSKIQITYKFSFAQSSIRSSAFRMFSTELANENRK